MQPLYDTSNIESNYLILLIVQFIAKEGLNYKEAKRKAIKHTGLSLQYLPNNDTIESALRHYLIKEIPNYHLILRHIRQLTCHWLNKIEKIFLIHAIKPSKVIAIGAVVNGTATEHSPIHIHIFTDDFKQLEIALIDNHIQLEYTEKKVNQVYYPVVVTQDLGIPIAMTILPVSEYFVLHALHTPSTSVLQSANYKQLYAMINDEIT